MNINRIGFIIATILVSSNAFALDYKTDNWTFRLTADGMVGFLQEKIDKSEFINDWDVKAQIFYKFNNTQRFGAVYSIDADAVEDKEYIHDAFILFEDKDI